jgi:hypothetical protein
MLSDSSLGLRHKPVDLSAYMAASSVGRPFRIQNVRNGVRKAKPRSPSEK